MRFGSELRRKAEQIFVISTYVGTIFARCQVGRGHGKLGLTDQVDNGVTPPWQGKPVACSGSTKDTWI